MQHPNVPTPLEKVHDFGQIEAESDELLEVSFSDHPAMAAVLQGRRFLVLGRKGSGKTAIYRALLGSKAPARFVCGYSFVDYPWQYHDKLQSENAVDQERYLHSWKYLLLLTAAKTIINEDESPAWSEGAAEAKALLREFLENTYGSTSPSLSETFSPSTKQSFFDRLTFDLKFVQLQQANSKENPSAFFQEFNRRFEDLVLQALHPEHEYLVCFDELDRGFDPADDKYKQRLIGLLMASRDLSRANQDAGKQLKPVVFLRSDIYAHLFFEDKNKLTDTFTTTIEWEYENGPKLKDLMERRFHARTGIDANDAWERVFDETKEMRGRQSKYAHIVAHTLRRPRDIIKFCNCVLDVHRARRPAGSESFTNEDVNNARKEYSKYFRRELEDEAYRYLPDVKVVFEVLRHPGLQVFERAQFVDAYGVWKEKLGPSMSADELLQKLFELSIVGFKRIGGSGGGSAFIFKYTDPESECNTNASEFKIHLGLVDTLGIKRYSRASSDDDWDFIFSTIADMKKSSARS